MTTHRRNWYWKLGLAGSLAISGTIFASQDCAFAQSSIIPDNTLGAEKSVVIPNFNGLPVELIDGGAQRGHNLFHSFQQFNVSEGRGAYFTNPAGIENILSRVTGNDLSDILGTLGVAGGNANLFLMNPNGIVFGPNASLDVGGSFAATTANTIQFGDRGFFSASVPNDPGLLTVNPSAFFFNQIAAGSIISQSGLQVPDGQSLLLLGGDVVIDGGRLNAPDGRVEFGGVAGSGTVGLNVDSNELGLDFADSIVVTDVSLINGAKVNVSGEGGGFIQVQGDRVIFADASEISADTLGNQNGKGISIQASQFIVQDGAQVSASAIEKSQGNSGGINVNALELVELIGVSSSGQGGGKNGGAGGGQGGGSGGGGKPSKLASDSRGAGQSGDLTINTKRLIVRDGARVSSSTIDVTGGNTTVNATESVEVIGSSGERERSSGLSVQTRGDGQAGVLTINTGRLIIRDGAEVSASTFGKGAGGSVNVSTTESVEVIGTSEDGELPSRLVAETGRPLDTQDEGTLIGTGQGGSLDITTGRLIVRDGAEVSVSGLSRGPEQGDAGNLQITADSIRLDNQGDITATTTSGKGGNIMLQDLDLLLLRRNSNISTTAGIEGKGGNGGNVTINTDLLVALEDSNITADAFEGEGGNIEINTQGDFRSLDSDITADSNLGIDGVVEINTPDVELQSSLTQLSANFISSDQVVAGSCLTRRNAEQGSFVVTGTGGLPRSPYEAISGRYPVTGVQPIQGSGSVSKGAVVKRTAWKRGDPIQEAQGMAVTADGRTLVGTTPQLVALAKAKNLICYSD